MKSNVSPEELQTILQEVQHEKPQLGPVKKQNKVIKYVLLGLFGLAIPLNYYRQKSADPNEQALNEMQNLLEKKFLAAPSTAKWIERRVLRHEATWWAGYFELDAQNTYGAMIRSRICLAMEIDGGQTRWRPAMFVDDNCEPSNEQVLNAWLTMQGWGKKIEVAQPPTP